MRIFRTNPYLHNDKIISKGEKDTLSGRRMSHIYEIGNGFDSSGAFYLARRFSEAPLCISL